MKIKKHPPRGTVSGIPYQKKVIESDREEGVRFWQEESNRIYVTCPQCSKIDEVTDHTISEDGAVNPCVSCRNCQTHYFPQLLNWDGRHSLICNVCQRVVLFKAGEKETGWKKVSTQGCSCCVTVYCPKCAKKKDL